jgi:RNA polymerase sigma factor (sigma-70 family)
VVESHEKDLVRDQDDLAGAVFRRTLSDQGEYFQRVKFLPHSKTLWRGGFLRGHTAGRSASTIGRARAAMIFERRNMRGLLRGIVRRLTTERVLEEDLIQEAIIHLWLREKAHPGQRQSWYIQSCRLYLQNFLRKGHSVDGGKHRHAAGLPIEPETQENLETHAEDTFLSLVCARDLLAELGKWLTPLEKEILSLAHDGLSLREIGGRLNLSHTSVLRHRHNIAALAGRLGLEAPPSHQTGRAAVSFKPSRLQRALQGKAGGPIRLLA